MKKFLLSILFALALSPAFTQNWQYVGAPYINQTVGYTTSLDLPDMEFNAAGDIFIGYAQSTGELYFAKYTNNTWTKLASPGTFTPANVDIEVQGNNYYFAYSCVRGNNMYAYVTKYNGSSWDRIGDSMLLGNSGSGGHFDFLLDNNGVPTLLGAVPSGTDKQIMQYTGGTWNSIYTISNSAATVFMENSGIFDSQNKLLCAMEGYTLSPFSYYNVVLKIDGNTATTIGDTISNVSAVINSRLKIDAGGTPYFFFDLTAASKVMEYKLVGNSWSFIADTTKAQGALASVDITGDGQAVFNTVITNVDNSMFLYKDNTELSMDSINISGFGVGAVGDVVIPAGSTDVYVLVLEVKSDITNDYSVVKHSIQGVATEVKNVPSMNNDFLIYPNPSAGSFTIPSGKNSVAATTKIYDINGQLVYNKPQLQGDNKIVSGIKTPGMYFVELTTEKGLNQRSKLIIE